MKRKLFTSISVLVFISVLNAQTWITGSNTIICSGETTTLTAHHDFLHHWCFWNPTPLSYDNSNNLAGTAVVAPNITTTYTVNCYDVDYNGTTAIYTQTVSLCLGILSGQLEKITIQLYPNPTNELITIIGLEKNTQVEIFNATGIIIYSSIVYDEKQEINMKNYSNGIYFFKINTGRQEIIKKVIKQ